MSSEIAGHIKAMIELGQRVVEENPELNQETENVNSSGDHSIGMDIELEETFVGYLKENNIPCSVYAEERGFVKLHPDPQYLVQIDPLDGSTNYKVGKGVLPFGSLIAFYQGVNPQLKDVIAAGFVEYTRKLVWIYVDGVTSDAKGNPVKLKDDWTINRSTPVYLDLYAGDAQKFAVLNNKLFVRNEGSTSGNLSLVLSNIAAATGSAGMKPEEIGAVYALVKGAGGLVVDHQGKDMGDQWYAYDRAYEILAGAPKVTGFAANALRP